MSLFFLALVQLLPKSESQIPLFFNRSWKLNGSEKTSKNDLDENWKHSIYLHV